MREYVEKTLHAKVESEPVDTSGVPLHLRGLYSLELWTAFNVSFAVASPAESPTVKTLAKHRDALEGALGIPVAFALRNATGYRIGRMLEAGLPFVVPDRQVYLPFLGIALSKERSRANVRQQARAEKFSPQAQRLALMALYGALGETSVSRAADLLGVTKMTASRSFDELEAADPSLVAAKGRQRVLLPVKNRRALWQRLEPHLSSPVAREYRLGHRPDANLPLSGISALCELSMLQDNRWPTLAVTREQERALDLAAEAKHADFDENDDPACVVQVMRYEPVLAPGCAVDPVSSIMSLPDDERDDPRVAGEIEDVLDRVFGGGNEGNR